MSYAAEKKKQDKNWKRWKKITLAAVLVLLLGLFVFSLIVPPVTWKYRVGLPDVAPREDGQLRMHFLDVGHSEAIVIELPDGKTALIDGGKADETTEKTLLRHLNALEIDVIDYLIVTHADSDHCGALATLLEYKEIGRVFLPLALPTTNEAYARFYTALLEKGCDWEYSKNGVSLGNDEYALKMLYPFAYDVDNALALGENLDENRYSCVLWLEYNGVGTLFTGEIDETVENTLLDSSATGLFDDVDLSATKILKVAHHGSNTSTGERLLDETQIETAIISCGENVYGHPTQPTLERLTEREIDVYRTDEHGYVIIGIDENAQTYTVTTENCE